MATPGRIARKARALLPRRGVALRGRLRTRSVLLETLATTALYAVVVTVAVAFASPWRTRPDPAGPALERYAPIRDGAATLFAKLDERYGRPMLYAIFAVTLAASPVASEAAPPNS